MSFFIILNVLVSTVLSYVMASEATKISAADIERETKIMCGEFCHKYNDFNEMKVFVNETEKTSECYCLNLNYKTINATAWKWGK